MTNPRWTPPADAPAGSDWYPPADPFGPPIEWSPGIVPEAPPPATNRLNRGLAAVGLAAGLCFIGAGVGMAITSSSSDSPPSTVAAPSSSDEGEAGSTDSAQRDPSASIGARGDVATTSALPTSVDSSRTTVFLRQARGARGDGWPFQTDGNLVTLGNGICDLLRAGGSAQTITDAVSDGDTGATPQEIVDLVNAAGRSLC